MVMQARLYVFKKNIILLVLDKQPDNTYYIIDEVGNICYVDIIVSTWIWSIFDIYFLLLPIVILFVYC